MYRQQRGQWVRLGLIVALAALAVWVAGPWHPSIKLGALQRSLNVRLGLDLQGGVQLTYKADISGIEAGRVSDALAGVRDVIERRVNTFGVAEPLVQTNRGGGEQRVIVELAGVYDPLAAIKLIGETPQLDFRREVAGDEAKKKLNIDDATALSGPIFERTELSGKNLKRAAVEFDQISQQPQVALEFDGDGSKLFAELTKQNLQKRIAIYLDSVPISAPVVQSEITNGRAVISGGFTLPEAKQLAQRLNAGALPVPVELISQQTIGPTLGRLSIQQSILAGILGLAGVIIFMITFYRLPGVVAGVALVLYALLFIMLIKLLPITMTLAGVAGFILSIGMAVDANILIFERIRDNLRTGKTVAFSVENGFKGAWSSIRTSNIATLLTGVIMYALGTSIIRGFALTLSLGVILSMFTAIVATRTLLRLVLQYRVLHRPILLAVRKINEPVV